MLGTAKAYALCAERRSLSCVVGGIRIGSYAKRLIFVGKLHNSAEVTAVGVCGNGGNKAIVNVTRRAVEGNAVTLVINLACKREALIFFVHFNIAAAGNTARSHTARNNRRVRGLSAAHRKNALRELHALDILGRGFKTDKYYLLALFAFDNGVLCGEDNLSRSRAGGSRNTLAYNVVFVSFFQSFGVKLRVQKHIKRLSVNLHKRFLLGNHPLVDKVASDFDSRRRGTLAVTRLQHIKLFVFYGEFHILHIAVMVFENFADL